MVTREWVEKNVSAVTTGVKRLSLVAFTSIFTNYFALLLTVAMMGSELSRDLLPDNNALSLYLIMYPFTFGLLYWILYMRKRNESERTDTTQP